MAILTNESIIFSDTSILNAYVARLDNFISFSVLLNLLCNPKSKIN